MIAGLITELITIFQLKPEALRPLKPMGTTSVTTTESGVDSGPALGMFIVTNV
jgi:hypothetical protein